jgi:hypothetical protein
VIGRRIWYDERVSYEKKLSALHPDDDAVFAHQRTTSRHAHFFSAW